LATHCVTGIQWGAKSIVTVEYAISENGSKTEIEGMLQAKFLKISSSIRGEADVVNSSQDEEKALKFNLKMFGDFLPENQLPQTVDDAIQLMKEMPRLAQAANGGKGKPVLYTLTPLSFLTQIFKLNIQQNIIINEVDQEIADQFVALFDQMLDLRTALNDLRVDMEQNSVCLAEDSFKQVAEAQSKLRSAERSLRGDFHQLVTEVRAGKKTAEVLTNALHKFYEQRIIENTQSFLRSTFVNNIKGKITFVKSLHSSGVLYVGKQTSLRTEINKFQTNEIIVFFYRTEASEPALCRENQSLFRDMIHENNTEGNDKRMFILADIDIYPELSANENVGEGVRICSYKNGQYIDRDLLLNHKQKARHCYAKSSQVEHVQYKPNNRVHLEIRCPHWYNQSGCSKENRQWLCSNCEALLEYSLDDYFHCDCGRAKCSSFSFKCCDKHHGGEYIYFRDETTLKDYLSQMRTQKEVNILILGKTGVGKSTWINALANYLSYSSLEEAEKGELIKLIPGSFTMIDNNGEERVVNTGSDPNERSSPGQSCTKEPRAYAFCCGDTLVRLIDTPGIGDTEGIKQDEKNMELTFRFISQYDELHGICILLKPNEARLDVVFRFCINGLLVRLHKTANANICFCFTNSRSTFYQPGDTYPVLKQLLSEYKDSNVELSNHTKYCFDNEAFRYICAVHNKVSFVEKMRDDFKGSWNQSVQESQRLFQHISELKPHKIRDTTSVNQARAEIMNLAKPLGDISQNICTNITLSNVKLKESKSCKANEKDLESKLYLQQHTVEKEDIDYPRMVCTSAKCCTFHTDPVSGQKMQEFNQICHDNCELTDVSPQVVNNPDLLNCAAMNDSKMCKVCQCSWEHHMHIRYIVKKALINVKDSIVDQNLTENRSAQQKLDDFRKSLENRITQLQKESDVISNVCAQFARFLRCSAIAPFNDAYAEYINFLINQEKNKIDLGGGEDVKKQLEKMRDAYQTNLVNAFKQFDRTSTQAEHNQKDLTPEHIHQMVQSLYELPMSGAALKNLCSTPQQTQFYQTEIYFHPKLAASFINSVR
jgi:energy-coupling factor transporter ATP-binding protein EcfA2